VRIGANGQELGNALDDRQGGDLQQIHARASREEGLAFLSHRRGGRNSRGWQFAANAIVSPPRYCKDAWHDRRPGRVAEL
jgi:hypothetical protein